MASRKASKRPASSKASPSRSGESAAKSLSFDEIMAELKRLGTAKTADGYRRDGMKGEVFGVAPADYARLAKRIKVDHRLAQRLWDTGNDDARTLATMIADPSAFAPSELDAWAKRVDSHGLADSFAKVVVGSSHAASRAREWIDKGDEFLQRAGWSVMNLLVREGRIDHDEARTLLGRIKEHLHASPSRAKEAMSLAIVAIGSAIRGAFQHAMDVAEGVGPVDLDHGGKGRTTHDSREELRKHRDGASRPAPSRTAKKRAKVAKKTAARARTSKPTAARTPARSAKAAKRSTRK